MRYATINRWENKLSKFSKLARVQLDAFCERIQKEGFLVLSPEQDSILSDGLRSRIPLIKRKPGMMKKSLTSMAIKPIKKSKGIVSWPETERPREKLLHSGPESLSDGELLAVLVRIGKKGQSAEDLGRQILTQFNGISGIERAHIEELLSVSGMGIAKAAQLKAAIEIGKRIRMQEFRPRDFNNAADVATYIRPKFEGKRQEMFFAILLNGQNQLLAERTIAEGIPTQATVYVRRVMEEALRVSASAFIVVHNHPSGHPAPSPADDQTTQDLKQAADIMNLVFQDHIIIGSGNSYYSYTENDKL